MKKGLFGSMFDFNRDGKLDAFERAADFAAFNHMMEESEKDNSESWDEDDDFEIAGLDREELELMDDDERREALEDAGFDPDDYDF